MAYSNQAHAHPKRRTGLLITGVVLLAAALAGAYLTTRVNHAVASDRAYGMELRDERAKLLEEQGLGRYDPKEVQAQIDNNDSSVDEHERYLWMFAGGTALVGVFGLLFLTLGLRRRPAGVTAV